MTTTSQKTPDLESVLRKAHANSDRIEEIGEALDGRMILDGEVLSRIQKTSKTIHALEVAAEVVFSGIGNGDSYPTSEQRTGGHVLRTIGNTMREDMTPEVRNAFLVVLAALEKTRETITNCVDPETTDILY